MKGKTALMASVAAIALVASVGTAEAKKQHVDTSADAAMTASSTKEAVDAEKLDELEQRIEALESEVQQGEQREAADHDAVAGWDEKMQGWWDNTSISGRMYYDLTDINNSNNHHPSSQNGFSFDIKRFYVSVDHKFDDVFSADITTDVNYQSTIGQTSIFIKKAYLQAKIDDALTFRIGSADMPWIPYDEDIYGYRFVENTLIDRVKFGNSADWGVHVFGKFADGMLNYQVSVVSGSGYKKPLRAAQPDVEARVGFNWEGFQAAIGGYWGLEGATHLAGLPGTGAVHHYTRFDALAAYHFEGLKLGGEFFTASEHGNELGGTAPTHGFGYEAFASYTPESMPEWSVFGRYDYVKPFSQDLAHKRFHNDYFNVGINWEPTKIVDFALVYKNDAGTNGDFGDQNGTIGGNGFALGNDGTYSEIGLFGQFRW